MKRTSLAGAMDRINRANPVRSLSAGTRLWVQLAFWAGVATVAVLTLPVPSPEVRMPLAIALAVGLAGGIAAYSAVARCRPFLPCRVRRARVIATKYAVIGLLAATEEIIWRRILLGECLRVGVIAALAGSTLAFAVAHRARPGVHLATGAAFGGVYVATGALAASIAAHWTYNALLASLADRARARGRRWA